MSDIDNCNTYLDYVNEELLTMKKKYEILKQAQHILSEMNLDDKSISLAIVALEYDISSNNRYKELFENDIKNIQDKCNHTFEYVGHDSHHEYYKCSKCGIETRV